MTKDQLGEIIARQTKTGRSAAPFWYAVYPDKDARAMERVRQDREDMLALIAHIESPPLTVIDGGKKGDE